MGTGRPLGRRRAVTAAAAVTAVLAIAGCASPPVPPLAAGAGPVGAVRSPNGVLLASLGSFDGGTWVRTPCYGVTVLRDVQPVGPVDVLLDPGHGGDELGAVGPTGLREAEVNLAVAQRVRTRLEAQGWTVAMTRDGDQRSPIRTRGELAQAVRPRAFVSIHHNAGGPEPRPGRPGSEVFHQAASEASRSLAQLVWDREIAALGRYDIAWVRDDATTGPRDRLGDNGDYYGVLRYSAGVPAIISEAAFVTGADEERLLATDGYRDVEAEAIAGGIDAFLRSPIPTGTLPVPPATTPPGTLVLDDGRVVDLPPGTPVSTELGARPSDGDGCVDPPLS